MIYRPFTIGVLRTVYIEYFSVKIYAKSILPAPHCATTIPSDYFIEGKSLERVSVVRDLGSRMMSG